MSPKIQNRSRSILIVDDEDKYLQYLHLVLSQEGYRPLLAASGLAARKIIEGGGLSLVLIDLHLPDVSGLELMSLARSVDPLTVCIAMTAFVSQESAMEALRLGAYDYLLKPTGSDVVKAAVSRGIEHHELRRTLIERTTEMERFKSESRAADEVMDQVSHKLRNRLSVVYGYASYLAGKDVPELDHEEWRNGIAAIRDNALQMHEVLDDLAPHCPE